jgi:myo-inositol-1(or 4)-monophosphatase
MQPMLHVAISAARQAGDIMLRYRDMLDRVEVHEKNPRDLFSEVDVKAEQIIIQTLLKAYPSHGIIAEESGAYQQHQDYVWYIDPIDGTNNYLHGYPHFCVSIALRVKDKLECAVVYDPIHQECFSAGRGQGARINDRRLRLAPRAPELSHSLLGTTLGFKATLQSKYENKFYELASTVAGVRKNGAAALELAYVAAGRLDLFVGVHLKSWDMAAGALIIQEAGGMISDLDGEEQFLNKGHILAGHPKLFKTASQLFQS